MTDEAPASLGLQRSATIAPPLPPLPTSDGIRVERSLSDDIIDRLVQRFEERLGRSATREEQDRLIVSLSKKLVSKAKVSRNDRRKVSGKRIRKARAKKLSAKRNDTPSIRELLAIQRKMKASSYTSHGSECPSRNCLIEEVVAN